MSVLLRPGTIVLNLLQAGARRKCERAFDTDFHRCFPGAVNFARRYLDDRIAEDTALRAFEHLWRLSYAKGTLPDDAEKLLYAVLRLEIAAARRHLRRRDARDDAHVIDIAEHLEAYQAPARVADGHILAERIIYLLAAMPPDTRLAFHTAWKHDFDLDAAARELDVPIATLRGRFSRAKRQLGVSLAREGYVIPAAIPRGRAGGRKPQSHDEGEGREPNDQA